MTTLDLDKFQSILYEYICKNGDNCGSAWAFVPHGYEVTMRLADRIEKECRNLIDMGYLYIAQEQGFQCFYKKTTMSFYWKFYIKEVKNAIIKISLEILVWCFRILDSLRVNNAS